MSLAQGKPNQGEFLATDIPVLKSFYRGTKPPHSTQYVNDLYERLKKVNQLAASLKDLGGARKSRVRYRAPQQAGPAPSTKSSQPPFE
ncbi:hypothetical protein [Microbulbifer sp. 2205BS26-8]|uniref:hypothetical protein n=1 Tax=Microbulbifer sp. 2205BS26-8 TaxID=3064386 RepID=UPI00273F1FFE|nr:hypothetical protein [Microbulbifer sp. 2205BS26-8]MDP5211314.1 hypothetical protein [Microbulbifer sp. 2205BS26-8]